MTGLPAPPPPAPPAPPAAPAPRPWRGPVFAAAAALWLPAAGAFVWSPLRECQHCVVIYLSVLPVFPGVLLAHAAAGEANAIFFAVGAVASLLLLALVAALVRATGRFRGLVLWPATLLALAQGIVLGHLLRL